MGDTFPRVKMGVGEKPHPEYDLADWVLGKFTDSDKKALAEKYDSAYQAVQLIIDGQSDKAMNLYNKKKEKKKWKHMRKKKQNAHLSTEM